MNKKTAQKWQKIKKEKEQVNESPTAINFKTHKVSESQAEIIIPKQYPQFLKNHQILVIECGKEKVLVQVATPNNYASHQPQIQNKTQISVLRSILDLKGIQCGPTGMFKGQIRILNQSKISEYNLDIVQFLIKETYFSRRDQYKVMKALKESVTHVYLKKTLYFDQIEIQVNAMMRNNQTMVKTGIIDKNTKLIFRTNCTKLTVGIELSTQTFQLNQNKQLYLQKMIQFLYVYLHRNTFFNNTHRLTLIFFGRCYYPQFKTLKAAYDYLLKENTINIDRQKFQINFSVALQKDYKGRIFQDVYRRIIWSSDMIDNFRQYFWQKISQFIFTLNCDFEVNKDKIGKFIVKSLQKKIAQKTIEKQIYFAFEDKNNLRIKPFIHKLKSKLADSRDVNIFQAISLISQQYRHHYKFRSLTETGNTILILSAGHSSYQVDELSYKMAKSYIYLTNISCSLINFSKKIENPLRAEIVCIQKKPLFKACDKKKMQNLSLNCIEKQVYKSPMNEDMIIWDNFQPKSIIYPEELIKADQRRHKCLKLQNHCNLDQHYELIQSVVLIPKKDYQINIKNVSFINVYSMTDRCLYIHQIIYDKLHIPRLNATTISKQKFKNSQIDIFQADLDKIIIDKGDWNFQGDMNETESKIQNYRSWIQKKGNSKQERAMTIQKIGRSIFKVANELQQEFTKEVRFQTMSNDDIKVNYQEKTWTEERKRKNSDFYQSDILDIVEHQEYKGKVNIFEQTYRNKNHQYNAGQKNLNKTKKFISHNKQRCKNNFLQSNIHYFMPWFGDSILKKLKAFMKNQYIEQLKEEEEKIQTIFQMERLWKNICFPLLTPIYTKYRQNFEEAEQNLDTGVIDESNDKKISILEDQICNLLMKNYQIQESSIQYNTQSLITKLSKGHVSCHLKMNGNNLARSYIIDKKKQQKIIPLMLYRYLCYQDKDCRFCAKYVYFEDKNYYDHSKKQQLETKTVKIVLACEDSLINTGEECLLNSFVVAIDNSRRRESQTSIVGGSFIINKKDPFQDFIKLFNQRYKQFSIQLSTVQCRKLPKKKKVILNFSKKEARALYHHQQVEIQINVEYNTRNLFEIMVSWNLCSSVIVSEFVENVMTMGRRSKLKPFLVTAGNIFNTVWSITTIGQIIFQNKISLQLLQGSLMKAGQWLWDSNDYYLHISGISFIQFKKDKKLILWRDNNNQKRNRDIKKDDSCKQYNKFFMRAAVFDFIGGIIAKVVEEQEKIKANAGVIQCESKSK